MARLPFLGRKWACGDRVWGDSSGSPASGAQPRDGEQTPRISLRAQRHSPVEALMPSFHDAFLSATPSPCPRWVKPSG